MKCHPGARNHPKPEWHFLYPLPNSEYSEYSEPSEYSKKYPDGNS